MIDIVADRDARIALNNQKLAALVGPSLAQVKQQHTTKLVVPRPRRQTPIDLVKSPRRSARVQAKAVKVKVKVQCMA